MLYKWTSAWKRPCFSLLSIDSTAIISANILRPPSITSWTWCRRNKFLVKQYFLLIAINCQLIVLKFRKFQARGPWIRLTYNEWSKTLSKINSNTKYSLMLSWSISISRACMHGNKVWTWSYLSLLYLSNSKY